MNILKEVPDSVLWLMRPNEYAINNILDEASKKGIDKKTGNVIVDVDKKFFRPTEVDFLLGDSQKAKKNLEKLLSLCPNSCKEYEMLKDYISGKAKKS